MSTGLQINKTSSTDATVNQGGPKIPGANNATVDAFQKDLSVISTADNTNKPPVLLAQSTGPFWPLSYLKNTSARQQNGLIFILEKANTGRYVKISNVSNPLSLPAWQFANKNDKVIFHVNGAGTHYTRAYDEMLRLRTAFGDKTVHGIFNAPSDSWTTEGTHAITGALAWPRSFSDPAVRTTFEVLKKAWHAGTLSKLVLSGHSNGAAVIREGVKHFTSYLKQKGYSGQSLQNQLRKLTVFTTSAASKWFPAGPKYLHVFNPNDPLTGHNSPVRPLEFGDRSVVLVLDEKILSRGTGNPHEILSNTTLFNYLFNGRQIHELYDGLYRGKKGQEWVHVKPDFSFQYVKPGWTGR